MQIKEKLLNRFLIYMVFSLIGNAIADYALLWYAISKFDLTSKAIGSNNSISFFYIGQAIGVVLVAPYVSVIFDKYKKHLSATVLDLIYGALLLSALFLFQFKSLNSIAVFILSMLMMGISVVHRSSVAFSVLKFIDNGKSSSSSSKLVVALTFSNMVGAALSGVVYNFSGFIFCMLLGIVTFIPSLFLYSKVFKNDPNETKINSSKINSTNGLYDSWKLFKKDKILLGLAISIGVFNIAGALIPAMLGLSIKNTIGEGSIFFSLIIGFGLMLGIILKKSLSSLGMRSKVSNLVPFSVLPVTILAILSGFYSDLYMFSILYFFACIGSSFRNYATAQLRNRRIHFDYTGRVNTLYTVFLAVGQIIGGLFVIPQFQQDFEKGSFLVASVFIVSILLALFLLPRITCSKACEEVVV